MIDGALRLFQGDLPDGWLACEGQPLARDRYPGLFKLLQTTYGSDGDKSFNLPDLRGRTIVGTGSAGPYVGEAGGKRSVQLTIAAIPEHDHDTLCNNGVGTQPSPVGNVWAASNGVNFYTQSAAAGRMGDQACREAGEDRAHDNMQPYLVLRWAVAAG